MPWKAASESAFGNGDNKTFSSLPPKKEGFFYLPLSNLSITTSYYVPNGSYK